VDGAGTWIYALHKSGEIPDEMEEVPAGGFALYMPGLDPLATEPTGAFLVDRHAVTNREFKRFVEDGGYRREEFWRAPFVEGDRSLAFGEAVARLPDSGGPPRPASWGMGDCAPRADAHPVAGVSW